MARSGQVVARERARAAKAKLDAERAERDKKIEAAATDFYVAAGLVEDLEQQIEDARGSMSAAVVALGDLGEPVDRIAALCGVTAPEVRALKKAGSKKKTGPADDQNRESVAEREGEVSSDE